MDNIDILNREFTLAIDTDAIVCTVNCVYTRTSKGVEQLCRSNWQSALERYDDLRRQGRMRPGKVVFIKLETIHPSWMILFPTKRHWNSHSNLIDIERGLLDLRDSLSSGDYPIDSISMPLLGCGLGGLRKDDVLPLITEILKGCGVRVVIYAGGSMVREKASSVRFRWNLTLAKAIIIVLLHESKDCSLGLEQLLEQLSDVSIIRGSDWRAILSEMDGYYIYGLRSGRFRRKNPRIRLVPGAWEDAKDYLYEEIGEEWPSKLGFSIHNINLAVGSSYADGSRDCQGRLPL